MGSSPFQALELEKTIIFQWLNPNFDGFELKFDKNMGLKIDLKIDLPLCPLPNRLIFQIQESCDLQGRPLGQTLTVGDLLDDFWTTFRLLLGDLLDDFWRTFG